MKRILLLILFCCFGAAAGVTPSDFLYVAKIDAGFQKGDLARIEVSPEIFAKSAHYPADIRIFDTDSKQWPFYITQPKSRAEAKCIVLKQKNLSKSTGPSNPYWQVDITFPDGMVHNEVEIETSGINYIRRVEVYTAGAERLIGSGYLIRDRGVSSRTVRYPRSDVPTVTLRVYASAENARESFEIQTVRARTCLPADVIYKEVFFNPVPVVEKREGMQTFAFDFGTENRRVDRVEVNPVESGFVRSVTFYSRNSDQEEWRYLGSREIYRLPKSERTELPLTACARFLKVEIINADNLPFDNPQFIFGAFPRWIVLEAATEKSAALYFGADGVRASRYDLKKRVSVKPETLPEVSVEVKRNDLFGKRFRISKHLVSVLIGVGSLILLFVVVGLFRDMKGSETDAAE